MLRGDVDLGIRFRRLILDEADRILIDNADTALVLAGPDDRPAVQISARTYELLASIVEYLQGPDGSGRTLHYDETLTLTPEGWTRSGASCATARSCSATTGGCSAPSGCPLIFPSTVAW